MWLVLEGSLNFIEDKKIINVVINDPHNFPETQDDKSSTVDIRCTDQQGAQYIVEMQVIDQKDYLAILIYRKVKVEKGRTDKI